MLQATTLKVLGPTTSYAKGRLHGIVHKHSDLHDTLLRARGVFLRERLLGISENGSP